MSFTYGCKLFELMEASPIEGYPLKVFEVRDPSALIFDVYEASYAIKFRSVNYCFAQQNNRYPRSTSKKWEIDQDSHLDHIETAFDSLDVAISGIGMASISEQKKCPDAIDFWNTSRQKRAAYATEIVEIQNKGERANKVNEYFVDVFYWYNLCWNEMTESSDLVAGLNQLTDTLRFTQNFYLLVLISDHGEIVYRNGYGGKDQQLQEKGRDPNLNIPQAFIQEMVSKTMEEFNKRRE